MTCGPQIRIHQRVDPKQQISMTVLFLFSVPKCWCIRVSLHMCRAIWPVAIWLHTQRSKNTVVLWRFHTTHTDVLESMSLGHYKYSGLRATCHLPLQIQWSESNMIRNIGVCSSILLAHTQNVVLSWKQAYTPGPCEFLKIYTWLVYTQKSGFLQRTAYTPDSWVLGELHCRHMAPKSDTCSFIGPKPYTPAILQKSEKWEKKKKSWILGSQPRASTVWG